MMVINSIEMLCKINPVVRSLVRLSGNNSWKITKLNHVAIAVPDLEKAASFYRDILRVEVSEPKPIKEHGVTTVFVQLDNVNIEVDNIYNCLKHLKDKNIRTLSAEPKIGASGAPVLFLHPKDTCSVLHELEHVPQNHDSH
ncbi:hypothetical protein MS3_00010676 [Schistosoma haematobium]|uniref:Methylmalonyl-CoA epimerase, mitochondrial n=1 Tax=Schistosoma haematobium TaxID=6185 RepID=A0A922LLH4_SCHHA|nr:hypothetical protein MS3_00010676 [Schistosoma haematobium]KAH9588462.1 hypothetical protein MS3_00010676 [Schistosoma haematobium]CAH8570932.1 unnamed protein product [Schistosoma haematobium]